MIMSILATWMANQQSEVNVIMWLKDEDTVKQGGGKNEDQNSLILEYP